MVAVEQMRFGVEGAGEVSALLVRPAKARWLLVLGHGAGAGMNHPFMEKLAGELARVDVATLRYQFPYMEERRKVPDAPAVLTATVAGAVHAAAKAAPDLPLFAGGKSMGGRMTSQAAAQHSSDGVKGRASDGVKGRASDGVKGRALDGVKGRALDGVRGLALEGVRGLVFFGFPLHPPKQPGTKRAEHLVKVAVPMLFLQGTRDALADLMLLRPVCEKLGARATLHVIETADHSFHVLKRSGRSDEEVLKELAETTAAWMDGK